MVSITATSSGSQNGSLSQSADESDSSGSVGSGVVLDTEGHILTNNHVVDGYDQYVVTMDDGTTYEAEFVGNDAPRATLPSSSSKDADASKLTPIEIGDSSSKLQRGRVGHGDRVAVRQRAVCLHGYRVGAVSLHGHELYQRQHHLCQHDPDRCRHQPGQLRWRAR